MNTMKKLFLFLFVLSAVASQSRAQDTLPNFSVKNVGKNRIIIGWYNHYTNVAQISIQRSFDSLSGYKTILTVPDPTNPQNGYVDAKANTDHMFYRLYIMQEQGGFIFSEAKRPVWDTARAAVSKPNSLNRTDSISIANENPADSLAVPPLVIKVKPVEYVPSKYVFTKDGSYVNINLPDQEKPKKYALKFFDNEGTLLFELKEVKLKNFKIDRTNFYHSGWFHFELYEDEKLLEKHKFYLEKEF